MTYDADGNLTSDSRWTYTWDAVNRLTAMQTTASAVSVGVPNQRIEFAYDCKSRRVQKKVLNSNSSWPYWSVVADTRYIYDGWNLIAEVNGVGSVTRRYVWGIDFSGSVQGAGGVAGLLMVSEGSTSYLSIHDARGNVTALVDATSGTTVAAYEYSPVGELVRQTGAYATTNPFRFSSKYTDAETGLVYYGKRYYSPSQGRFLGRDLLEEKGGINLYSHCNNHAINSYDVLGMYEFDLDAWLQRQVDALNEINVIYNIWEEAEVISGPDEDGFALIEWTESNDYTTYVWREWVNIYDIGEEENRNQAAGITEDDAQDLLSAWLMNAIGMVAIGGAAVPPSLTGIHLILVDKSDQGEGLEIFPIDGRDMLESAEMTQAAGGGPSKVLVVDLRSKNLVGVLTSLNVAPRGISRVSIVDHGLLPSQADVDAGRFSLATQQYGNGELTLTTLAPIFPFLADNADIVLYGCYMGYNTTFMENLSSVAGGRKVWGYRGLVKIKEIGWQFTGRQNAKLYRKIFPLPDPTESDPWVSVQKAPPGP
jgi:RHS repeat-associated protein